GRGAQADVEQERLEQASGQGCGDTETVAAAEGLGWPAGALDSEAEEVVAGQRGGFDQRLCELLFVRSPVDVDVARRSRALGEPEVEREAALQQPVAGCDLVEASEESVERDSLAVAREERPVSGGTSSQPLLECLPERCRVVVPHAARSFRTRSMKVRTRLGRFAAAARRRRGVVSPRSSTCWMASSICSGCVPASRESTIVRSGLVTSTPSTRRVSSVRGGSVRT